MNVNVNVNWYSALSFRNF